jgi:hypothetical protein
MGLSTAKIVPLHRTSTAASTTAPIQAGIYSITAGVLEAPVSSRHRLGLHIGRPVWAIFASGCDRPLRRRLRRVGDIALLPAGSEAVLERESPSTLLMVELAPALVQEAALEMVVRAVLSHLRARAPTA